MVIILAKKIQIHYDHWIKDSDTDSERFEKVHIIKFFGEFYVFNILITYSFEQFWQVPWLIWPNSCDSVETVNFPEKIYI